MKRTGHTHARIMATLGYVRGDFVDVEVREVVGTTRYESTEAMLDSFVRTSAPVVLMRRGLGDAWAPLEAAWKARIVERFGAGPQEVPMPANLTVGTRP